jgi:mannose-6-phosphate isomerase-like protein (cupin superfamily)
MDAPLERIDGDHFSLLHTGTTAEWRKHRAAHPLFKNGVPGKFFLHDPLHLTGMEISLNVTPPGRAVPFFHKHRQNEEVYLFVSGQGQFQVDGKVLDVKPGTTIRVAPDGVRTWRNNGTEDLVYLVIQARAGTLPDGAIADGVGLPEPVTWPE